MIVILNNSRSFISVFFFYYFFFILDLGFKRFFGDQMKLMTSFDFLIVLLAGVRRVLLQTPLVKQSKFLFTLVAYIP